MTEADRAENQKAVESLVQNPPRPRKTWLDWAIHIAGFICGVCAIIALCVSTAVYVAQQSKAKCTASLSEASKQQAADLGIILNSTDHQTSIDALRDFQAQSVALATACI